MFDRITFDTQVMGGPACIRDSWLIATLKPGSAPLHRLAEALLKTLAEPASAADVDALVAAMHRGGVPAITERLQRSCGESRPTSFCWWTSSKRCSGFSARRRTGRTRRCWSPCCWDLRISAYCRYSCASPCARTTSATATPSTGLPEALNRGQYLVPRLTRSQRRKAITGPVRLAGAGIAPRLVNRLLNENIGTRDDLPVLQHALMRTRDAWARDGQGLIVIRHYEAIGTVHRVLDDDADQALRELSPDHQLPEHDDALCENQRVAKCLFQALTEIDLRNRRIRRPAHLSAIREITGADEAQVLRVIERFRVDGRSFLVLSPGESAEGPLIDLSHESLIRQWHRWAEQQAKKAK